MASYEKEVQPGQSPEILDVDALDRDGQIHEKPLDATPKTRWERLWPVIACGAGLFSDGYLNGVSHGMHLATLVN